MYLTNENLSLVKRHESSVVSLKYLDLHGDLCQIDSLTKNLLEDPNNHGFRVNKETCLMVIPSKSFQDPFRSLPTTSFLCTNIADDANPRKYASRLIYDFSANMVSSFELELKFWVEESKQPLGMWKVDPFDIFSNLRSDVLEILEKINISTTIHRHGASFGECIVGFKGDDTIDLADNLILAKFVINNVAANYGHKVWFSNDREENLKLILTCNSNDGRKFFDDFIKNNSLLIEQSELLQLKNVSSKSLSKDRLFNDDCKLQLKLLAENDFIPYINLALLVSFFSAAEQVLKRLETKEFVRFIENYSTRINKKISIKS